MTQRSLESTSASPAAVTHLQQSSDSRPTRDIRELPAPARRAWSPLVAQWFLADDGRLEMRWLPITSAAAERDAA